MKSIIVSFALIFSNLAYAQSSQNIPSISGINTGEQRNIQLNLPFTTSKKIKMEVYSLGTTGTWVYEYLFDNRSPSVLLPFTPSEDAACLWFRWLALNDDSSFTELPSPVQFMAVLDSLGEPVPFYYSALARIILDGKMNLSSATLKIIRNILERGMRRFPWYRNDIQYQNCMESLRDGVGIKVE